MDKNYFWLWCDSMPTWTWRDIDWVAWGSNQCEIERQNDAPPLLHFSDDTAYQDMISHLASFRVRTPRGQMEFYGAWNGIVQPLPIRSEPTKFSSLSGCTLFSGKAEMAQTEHWFQKISNIHSHHNNLELSHRCQAYLFNLALYWERESWVLLSLPAPPTDESIPLLRLRAVFDQQLSIYTCHLKWVITTLSHMTTCWQSKTYRIDRRYIQEKF